MQISKKIAVAFGVVGLAAGTVGTIAFQTHAAETTTNTTQITTKTKQHARMSPAAASGSVTAISGNTITLTDKKSGTTYTVNASAATIEKFTVPTAGTPPAAPSTITVSDIKVGDTIMVQGTISGTNITATKIMDGMFMGKKGFGGPGEKHQGAFGTVASINGTTITLTGKDGKTYTVDASSANVNKIIKSDVSGIAVGDTLMINGTTSGSNVTAKNITDGVINFDELTK